jgi:hypothetical protein
VPDPLYLSLWLRDFSAKNALERFEQLLRLFPFSRLRPGLSALRIYALEFVEPPALEQALLAEATVDDAIELCREFENPDCAYLIDGYWEQWKFRDGWKLGPMRISLTCFAPEFENEAGDHLRIELGSEEDYLPRGGDPESVRAARSNLTSVLRLAQEIREKLPVERERIWTESEENFAELVEAALDGAG